LPSGGKTSLMESCPMDTRIKDLQDSVFLTKVARARRTPTADKIMDGPRLFDQSCEIMRGGIGSEKKNTWHRSSNK
jgi:hypothetical protein